LDGSPAQNKEQKDICSAALQIHYAVHERVPAIYWLCSGFQTRSKASRLKLPKENVSRIECMRMSQVE
jgi:hypothetical protein